MNRQEYIAKFKTTPVGESFTVPWSECDKMGLGRPESGATVEFARRAYKLDKTDEGIRVTRLK